jgi:rRNA maturation RNase YbeY
MAIRFHFLKQVKLQNRLLLKEHLKELCRIESRVLVSLDFIFCSEEYLLQINRQFLNHDYHTDIITFSLDDKDLDSVSGEIYISVDMVKSNSKLFGVSGNEELHRVIFHGVLHLCGYRDKTAKEKVTMTAKENENLKKYLYSVK